MTRIISYIPHVLLSLTILVSSGCVMSAQTKSPSLLAANAVRMALKEQDSLPEMTVIPREPGEMSEVVSRYLGPGLLSGVQSISGRDFHYHLSGSKRTVRLGAIVLRYPTVMVAKHRADSQAPLQNYFRNSMVLTRFAAVPLGNLLVVIYSENSGDYRIVRALNNLTANFEEASEPGTVPWGELESINPHH